MSYLSNQELIGKILAIIGLSLAPFTTLFARHYSRSLYFAQMLFTWTTLYNTSGSVSFSSYLKWSWLDFMPEFTSKWCSNNDFSCANGVLLTPGIVWLGGALILLLVIKIVACKKKEAKFLSFYTFYKGLMYWFYGPLVYSSTKQVVKGIQNSDTGGDFMTAVIVLAVFVAITIVEVIAYKATQREEENIWKKWIEFSSHYMVAGVMVCAALSETSSQTFKYIANAPLGIFSIIYIIKYKFIHRVIERILMLIQDAIIIVLLNLSIAKPETVVENLLDFYGLAIVIVIELIIIIVKTVIFCKRGGEEDTASVAPEKEGRDYNKERKNNNSFSPSINQLVPEASNDELRNSGVKPGGSPKRRPPRR